MKGAPADTTFAGEPFVVQHTETVSSYNTDGTGFRDQTIVVRVQSEAALRSFSVLSLAFASASEHAKFRYARVRHSNGAVVATDTATALEQTAPVTRDAPLYSDLKQLQLPVKSLRVGDTLEWQAHIETTKPEAPGQFWGQASLFTGAVVLAEDVELRVPAGHPVTVWTNPATGLKPIETTQGTQHLYHWHTAALDPTVGSIAETVAKAKAKKLLTPDEQLDLTQGKLADFAWTTFPNWEAVGAWYRALEATRIDPGPAITAKVNELTAGKTTEEEKVRAVYNYVSGQVRYVGIDLGVGRYQPHPAAEVLDNQYGDCKDKHTLLAAMLAVLGLHSDAVLIGSGVRFNNAVPSPASFNHLITRVKVGNGEVWLDSTEEVAPFRMLFVTLRDKQALVVPETGPATLQRTPADPPFSTFEHMTADGAIDKDGVSESHFTLTLRGDEELLTRVVLRQVSAGQYDQLAQSIVGNLGFAGTVSHAQFLHADDTAQPLIMEWDYHREQAGNDWGNLRTLPQVLTVLLPTVDEKNPPTGEIQLLGARSVTSTSEMKLPAGWSAELPEAVHAPSDFGTYDLTFRYSKGVLYADRRWTLARKAVPQADWKRYKAWLDAVGINNEPYIQLRSTTASLPPPATPVNPPSIVPGNATGTAAPDAAHLVSDADRDIRGNLLDEAATLLSSAKSTNPQQRNLWGTYGFLALRRGDHPEAIRCYSKELELHPDSLWTYAALANVQYLTGDHASAIATMRRYTVQVPDSADAASDLINYLLIDHQATEADASAHAALKRLPAEARTAPRFQLVVGEAQLRGGEPDAGAATLMTLLNSKPDPLRTYDAAYELAKANRELPLAESSERAVVEQLTAETQTWTLDEVPATLRSQSNLLTACWDTLGWILYREGKFPEAAAWIEASWHFRQGTEVGTHLGDVQLAMGHKAEALHSYQLALATAPTRDSMGVRLTSFTPETIALSGRIGRLKRVSSDAAAEATKSRVALQTMRTLPLPSALAHDGHASYKLLMTKAGVKRAEPSTATDLPGGTALLVKAKLPADAFPPGSEAVLMREGMLNCHSGACELVLLP